MWACFPAPQAWTTERRHTRFSSSVCTFLASLSPGLCRPRPDLADLLSVPLRVNSNHKQHRITINDGDERMVGELGARISLAGLDVTHGPGPHCLESLQGFPEGGEAACRFRYVRGRERVGAVGAACENAGLAGAVNQIGGGPRGC